MILFLSYKGFQYNQCDLAMAVFSPTEKTFPLLRKHGTDQPEVLFHSQLNKTDS